MKQFLLRFFAVVALGGLATLYFWPQSEDLPRQTVESPEQAPEPAIRYPVESNEPTAEPLPALAESDNAIKAAIMELFGQDLSEFLYAQKIVHRIVATVDNLPREHVSAQLMPLKPVPGLPATEPIGASLFLSPGNASRYERYMRFVDAVPAQSLIAIYARYYPLFQEQYEKLGYPDRYFNDRVVEVVDHLLATPEIEEPVRLVQPRVLYEFADPKLESLSAGQKIFLRMGRANRDKLKTKLQKIRQALVTMAPKE